MRKAIKEELQNFDRVYFIKGDELVYGMFYKEDVYTNDRNSYSIDMLKGVYHSPHMYNPNETEILREIIVKNLGKDIVGNLIELHKTTGVIIDSKVFLCMKCGKESVIYEDIDWGGIYRTWDKCC